MLYWGMLILFKINIFENFFRNAIRVLNSLDPDLVQHFFGPDLGRDCLQTLYVGRELRVNLSAIGVTV